MGKKLDELRQNRNFADYKPHSLSKGFVLNSKKCAEEIFLMLDELYKHPLRLMKRN